MEMELNTLIEKIKHDGVLEAEKKSHEIMLNAEKKSEEIIHNAEKQRKNILQETENEINKLKKLADESINQSIRDALLLLRQKITGLCDTILKRQITETLSLEFLKEMISKLIENFKKEDMHNIEILVGKKDKDRLEQMLLNSLGAEMKKGITFKISPSIETGFRIGEKDKNYYYDFTDEALTEALRMHINPKIIKILDKEHSHAE
jgi:V/A-type H+-transporting ATPase subunit E